MAKDTGKNAAANGGAVDTADWQKEQIGFDPYFRIEEGASFVGTIIGRDDRDKKFVRYTFMAAQDMVCQRGPVETPESVNVKQGETFNISLFYSLEKPFNEYLDYSYETGKAVLLKLTCTGSAVTKEKHDVWLWDCQVPPVVKTALQAWRREKGPRSLPAAENRRQIES